MSTKILGPIGVKAFEGRGISCETAARLGIYTARSGNGASVVPDAKGNIVVFPFEENGVVVNEKFRGPDKKFWQSPGGRKTFWNSDVLDDPSLVNGSQALIITEGEIDAVTAIDCGHPFTVSVPDGAPPPPKGPRDEGDIRERIPKFDFIWNNHDRLERIKRFIIAVDNDAPGQHLASELVRLLNAAKCYFVTYPDGCKDLNDVRMQHGPERVTAVLNGAQPYPVKDIHTLGQFPDAPPIQTFSTGWETVDDLMKLFAPSLTVVTGIPSHGKSSWLTNLLINASEQHGWRHLIYSPEMPVIPHLRDKMRRIVGRKHNYDMTKAEIASADRFLNDSFLFIQHMSDKDDLTLEWLLDRAKEAVLRYGVRTFTIDPWNEVEHAKYRDESSTEYIARGLRLIKRFMTQYEVAVFIVAHPTKDVGAGGKPRAPTLYDVDGSAAWFNKPDVGIVIERPDSSIPESLVHIAKIRFEGTGQKGSVRMRFDHNSSRYEMLDGRSDAKDHYGKPIK